MKADRPAERLRVKVAARGIAACSGGVSAPGRGGRHNAALKADHPARGRASGEQSSSTATAPAPSRRRAVEVAAPSVDSHPLALGLLDLRHLVHLHVMMCMFMWPAPTVDTVSPALK
eukprot:1246200-Prymnesium_polylepis.1